MVGSYKVLVGWLALVLVGALGWGVLLLSISIISMASLAEELVGRSFKSIFAWVLARVLH
jgi:hypothetical protein